MFVQLQGYDIYYEDLGQGTPLLCLHAFLADGSQWREQHPLADTARLLMPDLPGQGRSSVGEGPYTVDLLADVMIGLLDHLGVAQTVVMGLSLGGYIAMAMTRRHRDRLRGLILADTWATADTPEARARRLAMAETLHREGTAAALGMFPNLFGVTTHRERAELLEQEHERVRLANAQGLAYTQLAMAARPDSMRTLAEAALPTLLLCGEEDTMSPPDAMRALAEHIPGARFTRIPEAGHFSALENPIPFNHAVRVFLQGLAG
jgi:pimeloyl-ACP methyl ester carboxylesterase